MLKSIDMVWCYRHKELGCLRRDAALNSKATGRGLRQKDRGTPGAICGWRPTPLPPSPASSVRLARGACDAMQRAVISEAAPQ
jgi:hypothetical protein